MTTSPEFAAEAQRTQRQTQRKEIVNSKKEEINREDCLLMD
jgi:hypothetical protein